MLILSFLASMSGLPDVVAGVGTELDGVELDGAILDEAEFEGAKVEGPKLDEEPGSGPPLEDWAVPALLGCRVKFFLKMSLRKPGRPCCWLWPWWPAGSSRVMGGICEDEDENESRGAKEGETYGADEGGMANAEARRDGLTPASPPGRPNVEYSVMEEFRDDKFDSGETIGLPILPMLPILPIGLTVATECLRRRESAGPAPSKVCFLKEEARGSWGIPKLERMSTEALRPYRSGGKWMGCPWSRIAGSEPTPVLTLTLPLLPLLLLLLLAEEPKIDVLNCGAEGCTTKGTRGGCRASGPVASLRACASRALRRRFAPPFHQFLIALSLLPFKCRAISAHRFPYFATKSSITRPSSGVMGDLLSEGFKFWWYRSLACFAVRVPSICEIFTQFKFFSPPNASTKERSFLSSSGDQGPLLLHTGVLAIDGLLSAS